MNDLTILAWNAHANHPSQAERVANALDQWQGWDVAALTEVKGARPALKAWAKRNNCRLKQERPIRARADERGDTALLIRKTVRVKRQWVAIMAESWMVFSHDVLHLPRRYRRTVISVGDVKVGVSAEHWPTRGNTGAWNSSRASAERFLHRRGLRVVVGDLNASHHDAWSLADAVGGKARGRRPDWLITNRRSRIAVTQLDKAGSDHCALLYKIRL